MAQGNDSRTGIRVDDVLDTRQSLAVVAEEREWCTLTNAAQDSISQRLYTPLILARIGASATDLGTDTPWIPTQGDLNDFVDDVNMALSADFRLESGCWMWQRAKGRNGYGIGVDHVSSVDMKQAALEAVRSS